MYRPGPMDNIPSFWRASTAARRWTIRIRCSSRVLVETYGIMVYQEQVMQTAQVLGGYSLGGADLLRRAMGKKKAEEMAQHRAAVPRRRRKERHRPGQGRRDLRPDGEVRRLRLQQVARRRLFAAGLPHGWLKVHYTAEFFCANMTVEMDDTDKLKVLFEDAQNNFGMAFEPPDVNRGSYRFEPISDQAIRYGLGAVKGTGPAGDRGDRQRARGAAARSRSLYDFCVPRRPRPHQQAHRGSADQGRRLRFAAAQSRHR